MYQGNPESLGRAAFDEVLAQPNLASPRYVEACRAEIRRLVPIVLEWQTRLPESKKHLLIGIKLGHETSIGGSAYHEGGNDLLVKPAPDDPVMPFDAEQVLSRGRAQIGYAAVKTSGIRTSGSPPRATCAMFASAISPRSPIRAAVVACVFNWEGMAANPGIAKGIHELMEKGF